MIDKWYADETDRVYRADEEWRLYHRDRPGHAVFRGGRAGRVDCMELADYLNEHEVPLAEVTEKDYKWWHHLLRVTLEVPSRPYDW